MFWNVTFIYNAFIRTTDQCKVQIAFVSLFYILLRWNRETHQIQPYTRAFNEFLYGFLRFFLISENSFKFANFFAEVTHSRSMHRSTTYVDAAYCYRPSSVVCRSVCLSVYLSVCRSVTLVSPAKTAAPIEMPFGLTTRVGPENHVLDGGPDPPMGRGNFEGRRGVPL